MTTPDPILLRRDGGVAHMRFNRPEARNGIDVPTSQCFARLSRELAADTTVRAVVISGEGAWFGAGGDLAAFRGQGPEVVGTVIAGMHEGLRHLTAMNAPVIGSLHGVVAGGSLSLALACDLAIAAEGTKFNLAYVNVGANCDVSGSWHLPRIVGLRNAMQIALLGETFDAAEALRLGMVNRVVPADQLAAETDKLAQRLANGPTLALGKLKRLLRVSLDNDLSTQLDLEAEAFAASARTADFAEAIEAFFSKRKPTFQGR